MKYGQTKTYKNKKTGKTIKIKKTVPPIKKFAKK